MHYKLRNHNHFSFQSRTQLRAEGLTQTPSAHQIQKWLGQTVLDAKTLPQPPLRQSLHPKLTQPKLHGLFISELEGEGEGRRDEFHVHKILFVYLGMDMNRFKINGLHSLLGK